MNLNTTLECTASYISLRIGAFELFETKPLRGASLRTVRCMVKWSLTQGAGRCVRSTTDG